MYAQSNTYDLAYLTAYEEQNALINLLEYYGFYQAGKKDDGELIFERGFSNKRLNLDDNVSAFDTGRKNYPRFVRSDATRGFGIPIKEGYHDTLYPDLWNPQQIDLFAETLNPETPSRPGNTIRKV